jgi:hypothetical protein
MSMRAGLLQARIERTNKGISAGEVRATTADQIGRLYCGKATTDDVGKELAELSVNNPAQGRATIEATMPRLAEADRDEVAQSFTQRLSDKQLQKLATTPDGRALLQRVKQELLAGKVHDDERHDADRIQPNGFSFEVGEPRSLQAAGNAQQLAAQAGQMIALTDMVASTLIPKLHPSVRLMSKLHPWDHLPLDALVSTQLNALSTNPPIGVDGKEVTTTIYTSTIPNATPQEAYDYFVNNPGEWFGAGGLKVRPETDALKDGGRYMLEDAGVPPAWLPIEVRLNPQAHQVTINTLDGHPLRGEQTFTFTDNGQDGVTLTQDARFQASSGLVVLGQRRLGVLDKQHEVWRDGHRRVYEHFNP